MQKVISFPIRLDMSVGQKMCAEDQECVVCVPTYAGKKCACPASYVLQEDNSCLIDMIDGQIDKILPKSEARSKNPFQARSKIRR